MMSKIKVNFDVNYEAPNKNGRVYTKESWESIKETVDNKTVYVEKHINKDSVVNLMDIVGTVDSVEITEQNIEVTVDIKNEELAKMIDEYKLLKPVPKGVGSVEDDGLIGADYQLISFGITADPSM